MRKFLLFAGIVLLVALLAGCVAPPTVEEAEQDVESAESDLCASISAYAESLVALQEVNVDTTVEELDSLKAAAEQAYDAMVAAWSDLQAAEVQVVESAVAELQTSLSDVPNEATLGEVAASIQESAVAVRASVEQLDQVACVGSE